MGKNGNNNSELTGRFHKLFYDEMKSLQRGQRRLSDKMDKIVVKIAVTENNIWWHRGTLALILFVLGYLVFGR